jgi:GTP cyclohydrolase I
MDGVSELNVFPARETTHGAHRAIDFPLTVVHPQIVSGALAEDSPAPRPSDERRIERAVREILLAVGEDPDREGLRETPARVARAYREIFAGLNQDPREHPGKQFEQGDDELVMVRDIEFHSVCEHHLLPFFGTASIAYQPGNGKVVGLSRLARTVEVFARRPQIQEQLTAQIADAIEIELGARGVTVVLEAEHLCMKMRGARSPNASMRTVTHRGIFREDREARQEVMAALGVSSR